MPYHKFTSDYLFTGTEMLNKEHVLIVDQKGLVQDIVPSTDAGDNIQTFTGLLSPGFINCHCHLELSHLKGLIAEKTGLIDFVFNVVTKRHFPEEAILAAIEAAETEMMTHGIVAVGDICNNTHTLAQKLKQRIHYHSFIELSGWLPSIAKERFEKGKEYYTRFLNHASHQLHQSLAPHAPYSVSNELWDLMAPFFPHQTITIHNQETAFEDDLFMNGSGDFTKMYQMMQLDNSFFTPTGKSSLQSYLPKLKGAKQVLLVHNTFIKEADISAVHSTSNETGQAFFYCLCVRANQYIENALPPIPLLRQHNCNITIGTDSLASNWGLNILDELKTIKAHFTAIPTIELLQWATMNGAKALQLSEELGSFEKGKKPGVLLIEHLNQGEITALSTTKVIL